MDAVSPRRKALDANPHRVPGSATTMIHAGAGRTEDFATAELRFEILSERQRDLSRRRADRTTNSRTCVIESCVGLRGRHTK